MENLINVIIEAALRTNDDGVITVALHLEMYDASPEDVIQAALLVDDDRVIDIVLGQLDPEAVGAPVSDEDAEDAAFCARFGEDF